VLALLGRGSPGCTVAEQADVGAKQNEQAVLSQIAGNATCDPAFSGGPVADLIRT